MISIRVSGPGRAARGRLFPALALWLGAVIAPQAQAQSTFASIVGTVYDPSGASVAGCRVTVAS